MREEDLSVQLLSKTSENIQKLFDLSTRIDERVKSIQANQKDAETRLAGLFESISIIQQRLAVVESNKTGEDIEVIEGEIGSLEKEINTLDKRISAVEKTSTGNEDRWKVISNFIVQLVWIVLAAFVLMKLNLNPPPGP